MPPNRRTCRAQDSAAAEPRRSVTVLAVIVPQSEGGGAADTASHLQACAIY